MSEREFAKSLYCHHRVSGTAASGSNEKGVGGVRGPNSVAGGAMNRRGELDLGGVDAKNRGGEPAGVRVWVLTEEEVFGGGICCSRKRGVWGVCGGKGEGRGGRVSLAGEDERRRGPSLFSPHGGS